MYTVLSLAPGTPVLLATAYQSESTISTSECANTRLPGVPVTARDARSTKEGTMYFRDDDNFEDWLLGMAGILFYAAGFLILMIAGVEQSMRGLWVSMGSFAFGVFWHFLKCSSDGRVRMDLTIRSR